MAQLEPPQAAQHGRGQGLNERGMATLLFDLLTAGRKPIGPTFSILHCWQSGWFGPVRWPGLERSVGSLHPIKTAGRAATF
jgi:hypothetical protein